MKTFLLAEFAARVLLALPAEAGLQAQGSFAAKGAQIVRSANVQVK